MILLDANVILRLSNRGDPTYAQTFRFVSDMRTREELVIAPQTLYEFWAVATRAPEHNGIGMDINRVRQWIPMLMRMFRVLSEPQELVQTWTTLVEKYAVKGFRSHDVRYVAMMQLHQIGTLMTINTKHFSMFPIQLIDPSTH